MKANYQETTAAAKNGNFTQICLAACKKVLAGIENAKSRVVAEFNGVLRGREHMVQLALNEAEALAWETEYPALFFPTLAQEKVQALANWSVHQKYVRQAA